MATDIPQTLGDYFDIVRRRWIYLATILPGAILSAAFLAFALTPAYRSSATILLEPSSIPENLIRTTVTAYADQQLELVSRRVLTTENLELLTEEIDPYPNQTALSAHDKAKLISENTEIERVDPITLEPLRESNAYSIHYHNPDPNLAMQVTSRMADMFLSYIRETRTEQATETHKFLQVQLQEASEEIAVLEQRLSDFKVTYGDALPEVQARNRQALDRVERQYDTLQQQIILANERKRSRQLELSQINPNLFDPAGDWRMELASLRAELAAANQRYTADHPDVRRLRRAIAALGARVQEATPNAQIPDNPEYIQVANQLETVNRELAALESSAARAGQQINVYVRSLRIAPEVEREYRQLLREYEGIQKRFRDIEDSLGEAALGQVLESEARGDRLTLIRPANRPHDPYSPNRVGIILLGIVLGGGLAFGLMALVESSDPTIRSARDLNELTDIKPLAAIPYMPNQADRRTRALAWGAATVAAAIAVLVVGATISQALL